MSRFSSSRVPLKELNISMVMKKYVINNDTIALLPAKAIDYSAIAWEVNKILYVRQTPLEIIKSSCLDYGSSYDGRRDAVKHNTPYKKKLPIEVSERKKIYAFPTHATQSFDCHWLFSEHILTIIKNSDKNKSTVHFRNDQMLSLTVSHYVLDKQLHRTLKYVLNYLKKD